MQASRRDEQVVEADISDQEDEVYKTGQFLIRA
jgi:hypothetical protein